MATASEIRSITSVLRRRTSGLSAASATSSLELAGAITRASAALRAGRPSGLSDPEWTAFGTALRQANAARVGTLRPSPFEEPGEVMVFTEEEVGIRPTARTAPPRTPARPVAPPTTVTGKVAEAVTGTIGSVWQGMKQAVGLPAEPKVAPGQALPSVPATGIPEATEALLEEVEEAVEEGAREIAPAAAAVVSPPTPIYRRPVFVVGATVGGAALAWLVFRQIKKTKEEEGD